MPSVLEAYRALRQRRGPEAASGHGRAWRAGASEGPLLAGPGVHGLLETPACQGPRSCVISVCANQPTKHRKPPGSRIIVRGFIGSRFSIKKEFIIHILINCLWLPTISRTIRRLPDVFQCFIGWFGHGVQKRCLEQSGTGRFSSCMCMWFAELRSEQSGTNH